MNSTIRNRIIGTGEISPAELTVNPKNWRAHPSHQQRFLNGVLDQVGWVQHVIVDKETGLIIDGHLRVALAIQRNEPTIPVVYVDLDEGEQDLIIAVLDPLGAMATSNQDKLDELLLEAQADNESVAALLAMLASKPDDDLPPPPVSSPPGDEWGVVVVCSSEEDQHELMQRFSDQGILCHALNEYPR